MAAAGFHMADARGLALQSAEVVSAIRTLFPSAWKEHHAHSLVAQRDDFEDVMAVDHDIGLDGKAKRITVEAQRTLISLDRHTAVDEDADVLTLMRAPRRLRRHPRCR